MNPHAEVDRECYWWGIMVASGVCEIDGASKRRTKSYV